MVAEAISTLKRPQPPSQNGAAEGFSGLTLVQRFQALGETIGM